MLEVGNVLMIGNERFGDLDEIIATHVEPMSRFCQDIILNPRFFTKGSLEEVYDNLDKQLKANKMRVPYTFAISYSKPTLFHLCFKMNESLPAQNHVSPFWSEEGENRSAYSG